MSVASRLFLILMLTTNPFLKKARTKSAWCQRKVIRVQNPLNLVHVYMIQFLVLIYIKYITQLGITF